MNSHLSNEELLVRLEALEEKVRKSNLLMRRPGHEEYERLVDVVCDHESRLLREEEEVQKISETVVDLDEEIRQEFSELEDINW
jgi:hypothetical protein